MALHPGERKRHFLDEAPVVWDPIRRALEENEDWYRDLVEHSQDLLCVHDLQGRFLSVNPVPARLLGYSVEEALRMRLQDVVDPQFRDQCDAYLREIGRTGKARGLMAVVTRSGEQRIWEYQNTLRTAGVAAPIVRGMAHDVTVRVRAQMALRAIRAELLKTSREQARMLKELTLFRTLLDKSNDAIQVVEPETLRFLDVNDRTCVELGYSREELLSMTVYDIAPGFDESARAGVLRQLQESGSAIIERTHRRKDGTTFPVEVTLRRVQLDREYGVAVARDITARRRAEEKLRQREENQKLILDHLPVGVVLASVGEENAIYHNPKFLELFGYSFEQFSNVSEWWPLAYPDPGYREWVSTEWKRRMAEAARTQGEIEPMEVIITCRDGSKKYVRVPAKVIGDLNFISFIDLTEQKQAEEALRESELRFRAVFERSPVGIALVDSPSGQILQANPKFCEIVGRSEEELRQLDVSSVTHPDDFGKGSAYLQQMAEGEPAHFELDKRYLRPDGSVRWVRILVVPMYAKGETRRWHMALVEDITNRKQAEQSLQETQVELAHVTRVLAMGELVTSIAHEVNQPLTGVVTNSNFALRQLASGTPNLAELQEAIAEIVEDARRVNSIISRVRTLLKKGAPDRVALAINDVIQDVTVFVRNEAARNGVQVHLDLAAVLPPLVGDRVQLQQVLINLVMNGIDAMRTVTDRPRKLDIKSAKHADGVLIQVQDSGLGLAPDRLESIFEPFFTTKPQGIGMGLSISRSIIESHGGRLWTVPVANGALFQFTLPTNWDGVS